LIVGSCATKDYKPRQVRKEAAVVIPFVCRRGAWLSTSLSKSEGRGSRVEVKDERIGFKPLPQSFNLKPLTTELYYYSRLEGRGSRVEAKKKELDSSNCLNPSTSSL